MLFRADTIVFRLALTVSILWFAAVAGLTWNAYRAVNLFDHMPMTNGCEMLVRAEEIECNRAAAATVQADYEQHRERILRLGANRAIIPPVLALVLAGFSGSILRGVRRVVGAYWTWLRGSHRT